MTAPITTDYPDWQRVASRATKLFVDANNETLNAEVTYGPFFVGDISYIAFVCDVFGTTADFVAEYYMTENFGTFLGDQRVSVPTDGGFDFSLPVQGPWVFFAVTPISATGTLDFKAYEVGGPLTNLRGVADNNILVATNSNVNAGASLTVSATRVMPGEAHWFCESAVATWTARVESVTAGGVATIIDEFRKTTAGDAGRQIFLPARQVQVVISNQSAGAGSFRAAIVARPLEAGR